MTLFFFSWKVSSVQWCSSSIHPLSECSHFSSHKPQCSLIGQLPQAWLGTPNMFLHQLCWCCCDNGWIVGVVEGMNLLFRPGDDDVAQLCLKCLPVGHLWYCSKKKNISLRPNKQTRSIMLLSSLKFSNSKTFLEVNRKTIKKAATSSQCKVYHLSCRT